ncbi:DUF2141 domain-containing protein [Sphingomonas cavernae]|uniref:DUF2141 domain-containing protein n=1 Tax=Sphingomonas cavernae TaxID=2320861 RepID=A0A418W7M6_9SPHN|nr:DUF2141 domain-containing protein [Sphingomonas cavernae]RJF85997.1 DUF2141 domain-containing protein [Sphingomonas cavernae]
MLKLSGVAFTGLVAAAMPFAIPLAAAGATTLGPHAASCQNGGPAVIARVNGLKARTGVVRVQLYTDNKATFLEKKQYVERVDVAATRSGAMDICVPVPKAGRYAISVRHDVDGNGKTSRADGGGFSGNPSVSISDLALKRKPDINRVAFSVGNGARVVPVTLNYIQGLSFKPVGA